MAFPANYRYTKEHEWVALEGGRGKFGITDYAQHQLGDIVFVELPAIGSAVTAGEAFGTVESVKAVSEIFAPVSGKVTAINEKLGKTPELLNQDAQGAGWLIEIEVSDAAPAAKLMDAVAYEKFVADAAQ